MTTRTESCGVKHAKWAMLIVGTLLAVVISVTLGMTNGIRGDLDTISERQRATEIQVATIVANQKAVMDLLKRIERIMDERRTDSGDRKP